MKATSLPTFLLALLILLAPAAGASPQPMQPLAAVPQIGAQAADLCAPLPPPFGSTVSVSNVAQLVTAVNTAASGTTILVANGTYNLNGNYLRFDTPNVTLRSASGDRAAVILDGNYQTTEIVQIVASNVTIADVTLREAYDHPIHVMSGDASHTLNTLIYNVHVFDPGQQAIKVNPAAAGYYADDGVIACSRIELTNTGRTHIRDNCYTGGVDAHQARGWVIRDNHIEGFWCASGLSEHAIHMWRGGRDTTVERNVLKDNARGVGFGLVTTGPGRTYGDNPCPSASGYVDDFGGVIRNNFIVASSSALFASQSGFDCGICLWNACNARVFNNTIFSTQTPFSSIEWRFANTNAEVRNNLASHIMRQRDGASAVLSNNLANAQASWFVNAPLGDLHLVSTAGAVIDQAVSVAAVTGDIDGDSRPYGAAPDIGADEYRPGLTLSAHPGDGAIRLTWQVNGALPGGATWRISYIGPPGDEPSPISGIGAATRSYMLTGLTNYTLYTFTVEAMQSGSVVLSASAQGMPTDRLIYLPLIKR